MEKKMTEGKLRFKAENNRYEFIYFSTEKMDFDLHCGDSFEAFFNGSWQPVTIEYSDKWYLVGFSKIPLDNLKVRKFYGR